MALSISRTLEAKGGETIICRRKAFSVEVEAGTVRLSAK